MKRILLALTVVLLLVLGVSPVLAQSSLEFTPTVNRTCDGFTVSWDAANYPEFTYVDISVNYGDDGDEWTYHIEDGVATDGGSTLVLQYGYYYNFGVIVGTSSNFGGPWTTIDDLNDLDGLYTQPESCSAETVDVPLSNGTSCPAEPGDEVVADGMQLYHFVVVHAVDEGSTPKLTATFDGHTPVTVDADGELTGGTWHFNVTVPDDWVLTGATAFGITPVEGKEPRLNLSHCTEGEPVVEPVTEWAGTLTESYCLDDGTWKADGSITNDATSTVDLKVDGSYGNKGGTTTLAPGETWTFSLTPTLPELTATMQFLVEGSEPFVKVFSATEPEGGCNETTTTTSSTTTTQPTTTTTQQTTTTTQQTTTTQPPTTAAPTSRPPTTALPFTGFSASTAGSAGAALLLLGGLVLLGLRRQGQID